MEFVETDIFTRRIEEILTDEEYGLLQAELAKRPDAGKLIHGARGLRKLRWRSDGKGKSGGMRVIYYLYSKDKIYMIYAFRKSEAEDLSREQLKVLAQYVKGSVI